MRCVACDGGKSLRARTYLCVGEEEDGVLVGLRRFPQNDFQVFSPLVHRVRLADLNLQTPRLKPSKCQTELLGFSAPGGGRSRTCGQQGA